MVSTQLFHSCNMGSIPIIDANRHGAMASTEGFHPSDQGSIPCVGAKLIKRTYSIAFNIPTCQVGDQG